jgi:hypothetical protein
MCVPRSQRWSLGSLACIFGRLLGGGRRVQRRLPFKGAQSVLIDDDGPAGSWSRSGFVGWSL